MGTYYTSGASREDIVEELLAPLRRSGHLVDHHQTIEPGDGQTVLWTVEKGERDGQPYQFIGCYLLQPSQYGWGYKPMDETMFPCYFSVPLSWMDKYPCIMIDKYKKLLVESDKWRAEVRRLHS